MHHWKEKYTLFKMTRKLSFYLNIGWIYGWMDGVELVCDRNAPNRMILRITTSTKSCHVT